MQQIFECTDEDGDTLTVTEFTDFLSIAATEEGCKSRAHLTPDQVTVLRKALRRYEEVPGSESEEAYLKGRQAAIDDYDYIPRDEHGTAIKASYQAGRDDAVLDMANLDVRRVAALEKAAEVAKELVSNSFIGTGSVSHETVLAYALYLTGDLPLAVQQ